MYEKRSAPLLSRAAFQRRMFLHGLWAFAILAGSLALGTAGFTLFADQTPLDAFLNASMLLGGMGPVGDFHSSAGKWFGAIFALYAGLVFIGVTAIVFAPVFHRILHAFHVDDRHQG